MSVIPRGSSFQVYVKVGERRWRGTAKTEELGKSIEAIVREALQAGREPDLSALQAVASVGGERTLAHAIEMVKSTPAPHGWAGLPSLEKSSANVAEVAEIIGPAVRVADLDQEHIDRLLAELTRRGNSNATINRKLSALSKVVNNYCVKRGWRAGKLDLAHLPEAQGRIRFLVGTEETDLLTMTAHIGKPEFADFWACLIDTGARAFSEMLAVEPQDVTDKQVTFWGAGGRGTKNGESRSVPLTRRAAEILQRRIRETNGAIWSFNKDQAEHVWSRVRSLLGKADDPQWVIHMLRHTCASRLAQKGVPIQVIKEFMGHKSITVTLRYAHLCPSNLTAALMALELPEAAE